MIALPSSSTVASLEKFIRVIRASPSEALRLPIKVDRGGVFGLSMLALQAVVTWARVHKERKVLSLAASYGTDSATRSRFASTPQGMAALWLADDITSGSENIPRNEALRDVVPYVTAMQAEDYRSSLRGTGAFLCCFEGARNEFLSALYSEARRGTAEHPTVRSLSSLTGVLRGMLDAAHAGLGGRMDPIHLDAISNLVYQLFNNADIHTVTNAKGDIYGSGVRGIQIRAHRFGGIPDVMAYVEDDPKLSAYLAKVSVLTHRRGGASAQTHAPVFVELSVFDSGPGLALRWLSAKHGRAGYAELSAQEELEGVRNCFALHATTQGTGNVGDGLEIAMKSMHQLRAYMALRSGRLHLLQDFSSQQHSGFDPKHRFIKSPLLGEIAGASYTICFPVPT